MARLAAGERLTDLCREYGISRKTGYDVGIREEVDGRWLVSFADLDLAHVDRNHGVSPIVAEAVATP